jgi:hypothetical protein
MRLTIRASEAIEANLAIDESEAIAAKAENRGSDEIDALEIPGRSFPGSDMAEAGRKFSRTGGTAGTDPCGWPGSAQDGTRDSTPPRRIPGRERRARPPAGG